MRIHVRHHVVSPTLAAYHALVVYGHALILLAQILIAYVLTLISARLVAQRPHGNTGVILVPAVHALYSVEIMLRPAHIVAEPVGIICSIRHRIEAVRLDIRLVYDIQTVDVAHCQHRGVGRIVRHAHGIAIILLHQFNIALYLVYRHAITVDRVRVVMIDA